MYDIAIIGGGTAGLTAAIYGRRAGKSAVVFEKESYGGQIVGSSRVENYPGIMNMNGSEFATRLMEQAKGLGAVMIQEEVSGEERLKGSGVSYCATCDGTFYKGRDVAVVGGGNTAPEDAEFLSEYCKKVYLIHRRDTFRGEDARTNVPGIFAAGDCRTKMCASLPRPRRTARWRHLRRYSFVAAWACHHER